MPFLAILLFALLCWLTIKLLRWVLRPLWPTSQSIGRTQFFVTDYFILLAEIGGVMTAFGNLFNPESSGFFGVLALLWGSIALLWIVCCRALSQVRVTRPLARILGLVVLPAGIAACTTLTSVAFILIVQLQPLTPLTYFFWSLSALITVFLFPVLCESIATLGNDKTAPTPKHLT